jgi:hypothetical protein
MFKPELGNAWLCIGNPTTTTSQAAIEEQIAVERGGWRVFHLSALDHPNITEQLAGRPALFPEAVTIAQVDEWVRQWCEPIPPGEARQETDFEWRPTKDGSGQWWRPGPIAQPRILGRRPSQGVYGVWSEALWEAAVRRVPEIPGPRDLPEIGCDVALYGDDFTAIHVRWGIVSLHHEEHNGWDHVRTAYRLKELAAFWAARATAARSAGAEAISPKQLRVKIDDDGVGGGVVSILRADGYAAVGVGASRSPNRPDDYPNVRSELWFNLVERAREGRLCLARLPQEVKARLRLQLLAPVWKPDSAGRRVVEPKLETKKKLGRSPDSADATQLAYFESFVGYYVPPSPNVA